MLAKSRIVLAVAFCALALLHANFSAGAQQPAAHQLTVQQPSAQQSFVQQSTKAQSTAKRGQLPRPQILGQGLLFARDAATGELYTPQPDSGPSDAATIRSHVTLVQVPCTAVAPDGTQVRGLTAANFRLTEDGVPQEIAAFDASATPASIALIMDVSPSIYRELGEMRAAARELAANLSPADEISVVSFSEQAHVILPFSTDRALLDRALDSSRLAKVEDSSVSNIYQAVFLAAREMFHGRTGRRALVLLTDGQDSGLGLTWNPQSASPRPEATPASDARLRLTFDDVARELGADGAAVFIVSTETRPHAMTPAWLDAHRSQMLITPEAQDAKIPLYTLYLAELARRVGGQLYFLREVGNLSEIYRRIALAINAQYTLGYYPSAGTQRPGWRALRVDLAPNPPKTSTDSSGAASTLVIPSGAQLIHRDSYYVSGFPQ